MSGVMSAGRIGGPFRLEPLPNREMPIRSWIGQMTGDRARHPPSPNRGGAWQNWGGRARGPVGAASTLSKRPRVLAARSRHLDRACPDDRAHRAVALTLEEKVRPSCMPITGKSSPGPCAVDAGIRRRTLDARFSHIGQCRSNDFQEIPHPPNWEARGIARLA